MDLNYDDICKHIGHLYLNSQFQIQKKDKENLDLLTYMQNLESENKVLKQQLADKDKLNANRPEGTSS